MIANDHQYRITQTIADSMARLLRTLHKQDDPPSLYERAALRSQLASLRAELRDYDKAQNKAQNKAHRKNKESKDVQR